MRRFIEDDVRTQSTLLPVRLSITLPCRNELAEA